MTDLNSKRWYRFLKVIYIFSFLTLLAIVSYFIYKKYHPQEIIDNKNSMIICNNGNKYSFEDLGELCYSDIDCALLGLEKQLKYKSYCHTGEYIENPLQPQDIRQRTEIEHLNRNYNTKIEHKTEGKWSDIIIPLLVATLAVVSLFEIIKRAFYYVMLGKVRLK